MNAGKEVFLNLLQAGDMEQVVNALSHPDSAVVSLHLCFSTIDAHGVIFLSEALKTNTTPLLTKLLLSNEVDVDGAIALANALKTNRTLTELSLEYTDVDDDGAIALAEVLRTNNNTTLTTLNLSRNWVEGDGAVALANALKTNTGLRELDLGLNEVGTEGAIALGEALKMNTTLTTLRINNNNVGDDGAIALANALTTNTTLTTLVIKNNDVGDDGVIALSEALETNTTLTTLDLGGVSGVGAVALAEALKTNKALSTLDLYLIGADDNRAIDAIEQIMERNKYKARLDSIVSALLPGSISEMVDLLDKNSDSLSITFDMLRIRLDWAPKTFTDESSSNKCILESAGEVQEEVTEKKCLRLSDPELAKESKRRKLDQD